MTRESGSSGSVSEKDLYDPGIIQAEALELLRKFGLKDDQLSKDILGLGIELAQALGIPDEKINQATSIHKDEPIKD